MSFIPHAIVLVVACCLLHTGANATSVVAVWTPSEIVIGADSKLFAPDFDRYRTACKIGISNDIAWADAGILLDARQGGFNIDKITTRVMATAGSIDQKIAALKDAVGPIYIELLTEASRNPKMTETFKWYVRKGNSVLEMVLAYYVDQVPHLSLINFTAKSDAMNNISLDFQRNDSPKFDLDLLGQHGAIDEDASRFPAISGARGLPGAVRYLIQKQMNATPETVGPPIAILRVDQTGPQWISKGVCTQ